MASTNDSTYFTDPTTRLKVLVLTGPGNFTRWMRDLKLVAELMGVWRLIDPESIAEPDREQIQHKPIKPTKPAHAYSSQQLENQHYNYQNDATEYTLELAEYKEQQKRLREARSLLLATLTPAIRHSVSNKAVPLSEVLEEIKVLYKPTDTQAQQYCVEKMEYLKYSDFADVSDLINSIICYQQELRSLGGSYSDRQVMAKVVRILPDAFCCCDMHFGATALPPDIRSLYNLLLSKEARLVRR